MTSKFSIFFLSFCMVSAIALPSNKLQVGSAFDVIKDLIKIVERILDNLIVYFNKLVTEITDNYDEFHTKVVNVTHDFLLNIIRRFKSTLDKIAAKSSDAGKKLATCVETFDDDTITVAVSFFDVTAKCAKTEFTNLIKSVGAIVNDLADVQTAAKAAADDIDKCSDDDFGCLIQVALNLLDVVVTIPDKVKDDIHPLMESIEKYIPKIISCYEENSDSFFTTAATALDKLATCAAA